MKDKKRNQNSFVLKIMIAAMAFILSFAMLSSSIPARSEDDAGNVEVVQETTEPAAEETSAPAVAEAPAESTVPSDTTAAEPAVEDTAVPEETPDTAAAEPSAAAETEMPADTAAPSEEPAEETKELTAVQAAPFEKSVDFMEDGNHVAVVAAADAGVLPSDANVFIQRVVASDDDYGKIIDSIDKEVNDKETAGAVLYAFTFKDANGNEIEPDGNYSIHMEWNNEVKPEGTDNSAVTVLKTVQAVDTGEYTTEDLLKNAEENIQQNAQIHPSTAAINQNIDAGISENAIRSIDFQSDSSGIISLVWAREFTVTVHYQDESYADISDPEVIPVSQEMTLDSVLKPVDNYSIAHKYMDSVDNISGLKAEAGRLYFNNGAGWTEAQSRDLYLIYAENDTEEEQAAAADESKVLENTVGNYKVSVSYGNDAGLPDDTSLEATELSEDSTAYQNALEKVKEKRTDSDDLHMAALDISLTDSNGNKIEPDNNSRVKVNITFNDLPEDAQNIEIHHIVTAGSSNENSSSAPRLIRRAPALTETAEEVNAEINTNDNNETSIEFEVNSFSVFTITWTKGTSDNPNSTRIGQVTLHYVDVNGLEINRTAELGDGDLSKVQGAVVNISDWVNASSDGTRKVSGYKYVRAAIGNFNGSAVSAVKVDADGTSYKLSYTSDGNNWITYNDPVSGNQANNADIYLVFKSTAQRVSVHFVDEDGNILINPEYVYSDSVYDEKADNSNQTGKPVSNMQRPIQNYEFTGRAHMGETGWQGFAFSVYRAQKDDDGNYRFQYKLKSDDTTNWVDLTATDVYLIYKKVPAAIKTPVEIKYVDNTGAEMRDEAGNSLDRTVDASEWTAGTWQNLQGYSEDVDGYTIQKQAVVTGKSNATLTDTDFTKKSGSNNLVSASSIGSVSGYGFQYLRYTTDGKFELGNGGDPANKDDKILTNNSTVTSSWAISKEFTIYLIYNANSNGKTHTYTVHYIDENGNEIGNPDNPVTLTNNNQSITIASRKSIDKYEKQSVGLLGRSTEASGGIPFTSITFTKNGINWNYAITNDSSTAQTRQLNLKNLDIYVIYVRTYIVVHFVDTDGNTLKDTKGSNIGPWSTRSVGDSSSFSSWNGFDFTRNSGEGAFDGSTSFTNSITNAGYTFAGEYIGPDFNMRSNNLVNTSYPTGGKYLQWLYQNGKWYTSHGSTASETHAISGSDPTVFDGRITDIYWVYTKSQKQLNIHYVYIGTGNSLQKINDGKDDQTVTPGIKDNRTTLSSGDYVKSYANYIHIGTRIGPSWPTKSTDKALTGKDLGPYVNTVYLDKGQLKYGFDNTSSSESYTLERQGISDVWLYAESTGRRFTLRKTTAADGSENYTLEDSQHGTFDVNLTSESDNAATYTAVFAGENETTEYTVTKSKTVDDQGTETVAYKLGLQDTIPNSQTDVYELYIDDPENEAKVWIDDDLKYSGYFMAGRNDWLETRMKSDYSGSDKITSWYYTWEKTVTGTADTTGTGSVSTTTSTVERQQNGIHWNLAYDRSDRTWLDIEADNGGLNTTTQQAVSYTLTMHYRVGEGAEWKTVSSVPIEVHYYDQLMNGSFETPSRSDNTVPQTNGFYTNSDYEQAHGVWQTTASDGYIEIVDADGVKSNGHSVLVDDYQWNSSTPLTTSDSAQGNHQFAELNANQAGALYQDVITHPNQHLNYWLSHRARGDNTAQGSVAAVSPSLPQYDTMYLIIMPTKLAMTSAADGGELKTQDDLVSFINNHGGYDSNLGTAVGQEITYRDEANGILIAKITSNDQFWHNISVPNGYIAKSGLTRFFFAAGPTAADYRRNTGHNLSAPPTQGNFIDAVGFSQELPKPKGFNLQVSKTFTGLNDAAIASLTGKTESSQNFTITVSDKALTQNNQEEETGTDRDNPSLNGAKLSFTAANTGGTYTFTPTAVDASGTSLLTGSNTGEVIRNDNNSITMVWTFVNQAIRSDYADASFDYRVEESNDSVENNSLTATKTITPVSSVKDDAAIVSEGTSAYFNLNNTYRNHGDSDQPRLIVSKTFYGLTPSGVDELFSDGYNLTVANAAAGSSSTVASVVLSLNNDVMGDSVSYTRNVDETSHNTTIRWTIQGWDAGTYTVKESGYDTSEYQIMSIKVNGENVSNPSSMNATGITGIVVGGTKAASIELDSSSAKHQEAAISSSLVTIEGSLPEGTNLIIAQYTNSSNATNYLVWTPEALGANISQGIINKINAADNGFGWTGENTSATAANTVFRSGANPGTISSADGGSVSYNSTTRVLSFSAAQGAKWNKFYSGRITSGENAVDISVENRYSAVRIKKVDGANQEKTLSGAEFILYRPDSQTQGSYQYYSVGSGSGSWAGTQTDAEKFITTDDGTVRLPKNLEAGTYFLEEVTAPAGYNRNAKPTAFQITDAGTVTEATVEGMKPAVVDWNSPYYTITIQNNPGYELPKTGGIGIWPYVITGALAICIAMLLKASKLMRKGDHL